MGSSIFSAVARFPQRPLTGDLPFHQMARPHLDHFQLSSHLSAELIQGELHSLPFI
jgi:hypothetical protein